MRKGPNGTDTDYMSRRSNNLKAKSGSRKITPTKLDYNTMSTLVGSGKPKAGSTASTPQVKTTVTKKVSTPSSTSKVTKSISGKKASTADLNKLSLKMARGGSPTEIEKKQAGGVVKYYSGKKK